METTEQLWTIARKTWEAEHDDAESGILSFIDGYIRGYRAAQRENIARSIPRVIDEHHHDDNESD